MEEEGRGIEYTVDGVTVKLPEKFKHLHPKRLDIDVSKVPPFEIIRPVTNFKLVDENDEVVETRFVPPFEMQVPYTKDDMDEAKRRNKTLQLADWDGNNWIRFTKRDHDFELVGDENGGYGKVLITDWPDPPVAWGT